MPGNNRQPELDNVADRVLQEAFRSAQMDMTKWKPGVRKVFLSTVEKKLQDGLSLSDAFESVLMDVQAGRKEGHNVATAVYRAARRPG